MSDSNDNTLELTTLYQANRNNQDLYMRHQWKVVHLTMIAYSVIFFLSDKLEETGLYALLFAIISVTSVSLVFLYQLEKSLCETRQIDDKLTSRTNLKLIREIVKRNKKSCSCSIERIKIFILFCFIEFLGLFLLIISITHKTGN